MIDAVRNKRYHQVNTVRRREKVSLKTASRKLGLTQRQTLALEDEFVDLPISVLYRWSILLKVPMTELLLPELSDENRLLWDRAKLVRVMKIVVTMIQTCESSIIGEQLNCVRNLLIEIVPELEHVAPCPKHGHPRRLDDYGAIALRVVSDRYLIDD